MKFKKIWIRNFRNFKDIDLELNNKNIVFGRNDFGKTNFLYALRFLFDPTIRKNGFDITDYHKRNTDEKIIICIELDIKKECDDNKFIRARVGGATAFSEGSLFIQLEAEFDDSEQIGNPVLRWGGNLDELELIDQRGIVTDLDRIFEIVYVSPNISPSDLFKKHRNLLYKETKTDKMDEIKKAIKSLNKAISTDERVQQINAQLSERYKEIKEEDIEITLKSEHEINGIFNHLIPYIIDGSSEIDDLYPTAGDGRQKILAYALTNLIEELKIEEKGDKRISIFLMEEIENSLHPSMQEMVSRHLFETSKETYPYLFITTHSEHMFTYMNDVRLIRIYKSEEDTIHNNSTFFKVPVNYNYTRKTYNEMLAQALFYDRVLLVEGMSEKILFEAIIERMIAETEKVSMNVIEKATILSIEGIGFEDYIRILNNLGIKPIVKTDNDIQKVKGVDEFLLSGINRCQNFYDIIENKDKSDSTRTYPVTKAFDFKCLESRRCIKHKVFNKYKEKVDKWKKAGVFLSEIELEEDLVRGLPDEYLKKIGYTEADFIKYLQRAKKKNMNEFVNEHLTTEAAQAIYDDERFSCIKVLLGVEEVD
ncbi:DUF2813 domain-containing protein [Cerasibacillus terrae]|uniref:DUF2813 domain-containing protein n=1 Tax=Cerasibacillus terrae TaxID=2498845 RepID=A0A5C8NX07_9BACI|nr:AAA family ATPase [Cerasibacillus terrae]TXL65630.1 DUF2813 domain-containing protein [Cerasibacillus terrae]